MTLIALAVSNFKAHEGESSARDTRMAGGGHYPTLLDSYFRHQSLEYIERMAG